MRFTVTDTPTARAQLARLWGHSSSSVRAAVTRASAKIDASLRDDPEVKIVALSEGLYCIDRLPLRAYCTVSEPDRLVTITGYALSR